MEALDDHLTNHGQEAARNSQIRLMRTPTPPHHEVAIEGTEGSVSNQDAAYARVSQTMLMRTPAHGAQRQASHGESSRQQSRSKTPATRVTSREIAEGAVCQDPRHYLMKRKDSEPHHARPRRLKSGLLPLERVRSGEGTHNLCTTLNLCLSNVGKLMELAASSDPHVPTGDLEPSLKFRDLSEARYVESRLQDLVNAWAEKGNMGLEVQYCLQTEAKGKSRVA